MAVIVFDMDGVLADTVTIMFEATNAALTKMGYDTVTFEKFSLEYNPKDWNKFYMSLGVSPERYKEMDDRYFEEFDKKERELIPDKKLFELLKRRVSKMYILSAGREAEVLSFLKSVEIFDYFDEVLYEKSRKTDELIRIAKSNSKDEIYFIGDALSDLNCLEEARLRVSNLTFVGIVHSRLRNYSRVQLSVSSKKDFEKAIFNNKDFTIESIVQLFTKVPELQIKK